MRLLCRLERKSAGKEIENGSKFVIGSHPGCVVVDDKAHVQLACRSKLDERQEWREHQELSI